MYHEANWTEVLRMNSEDARGADTAIGALNLKAMEEFVFARAAITAFPGSCNRCGAGAGGCLSSNYHLFTTEKIRNRKRIEGKLEAD